jgi:hypothetical protein
MTAKTRPAQTSTTDPIVATACHLYDADLHDAHQSHIDEWIVAASDRLHVALVEHLAAEAAVQPNAGTDQ